jgi:hypothetical protein
MACWWSLVAPGSLAAGALWLSVVGVDVVLVVVVVVWVHTGCATQAIADQAGGSRGQIDQGRKIMISTCSRDQRLLLFLGRREVDNRRRAAQRQAGGAHRAGHRAGGGA